MRTKKDKINASNRSDTDKSNYLRRQIYFNTLVSFGAYHVPIGVSYLAKWLGYANFEHQEFLILYSILVLFVCSYLLITALWKNITLRFADYMLVLQTVVWLILYVAWILILRDLRYLGPISAIVVFTFIFSYGRLAYSIGLSLFFVTLHLAVSYYAIIVLGQKGSLNAEIVHSVHLFLIYIFLSFMGYRVVKQKQGLIKTKHVLEATEQERQAAYEELKIAADHDYLTRLLNRRSMTSKLNEQHERSKRSDKPFMIAMLDIDHFKDVNDEYGHDCGDAVLIEVGRRIDRATRSIDFSSRWGGEEFLIAFSNANLANGLIATRKMKATIESTPYRYNDIEINLTSSIGVAVVTASDNIMDRIKQADQYLYAAKNSGRNQIVSES